jgi:hypothetical protein
MVRRDAGSVATGHGRSGHRGRLKCLPGHRLALTRRLREPYNSGVCGERGILTYRDYEALPDDGRRYELHEGALSVAPGPGTRHLVYVDRTRAHLVSARAIEGPPTLAVEILSPSTTTIDRRTKLRLYRRFDPDARTIEAYALFEGDYVLAARATGAAPAALPPLPRSRSRSICPLALSAGHGPGHGPGRQLSHAPWALSRDRLSRYGCGRSRAPALC